MNNSKLYIRLFLFLIPILLFLTVVEYKLYHIPNTYNTKRKYFEKQLDSIEVLTLGASTILRGVNPKYFSYKGFNLANVNQTLDVNEILTEKYLLQMKKLKMVILDIDYVTLYLYLRDIKDRGGSIIIIGFGISGRKKVLFLILETTR